MNEVRCQPRIVDVTIYPRQARITRRVEAGLKQGENRIIVAPLPAAITRDSLRVQTDSGCAIREIVVEDRVLAQVDPESRYARLEGEREALSGELARTASRIRALNDEYLLFSGRESILELLERERTKLISVPYWKEFLGFLEERLGANRGEARSKIFSWLEGAERLRALQTEFSSIRSQEGLTEHLASVLVDAPAEGRYGLSLSCLQEGSGWHPAYSLRVNPDTSTLDLSFYAMVTQQTGEDWPGVSLLLSTAMPREDCRLPELKSRRLREAAREAIVRREDSIPLPCADDMDDNFSATPEAEEAISPMEAEPALERTKAKRIAPGRRADASLRSASSPAAMSPRGMSAGMAMPSAPPPLPRPQPAPSVIEGKPAQAEESPWAAIARAEAALAKIPDAASLPNFYRDFVALLSPPAAPSIAQGGLDRLHAFFQRGTDPETSSGGFDYRYKVERERNDIPSVDSAVQVPVDSISLPVRLVRVTVPAEKEQAYLKAVFSHSGKPLLRGPAQVFLGNDFVSGIDFGTVSAEQEAELSLGVDRDIKIVRKEESRARGKGLIGKEIITDFTVSIELASFKDSPVDIEVYDRLPLARNPKEAEIFDVSWSRPPDKRSDRGILCWLESLKPGEKKVIEMKYSVRVKEDYRMVLTIDSRPHDGTWTEAEA